MWARSVCIKASLDLGTVIPFVKDAFNNNMSVIVFNPNERQDQVTEANIQEFSSMENHCTWVYENIIKGFCPAQEIYFVSHSMGGFCTINMLKNYSSDLNSDKIQKIAFIDSAHGSRPSILDKTTYENLVRVT
jgi:surfactin synthase thioesterase subunit